MTKPTSALALAFLSEKPESAARSLEMLPAGDAAAVLEAVPTRVAAPAIERMTSWSAARSLVIVEVERASSILEKIESAAALAILRQLPREARDALISNLDSATARNYRRSLAYAPTRVGAWIDHDVTVLDESRTVSDALAAVGMRERRDETMIFLTDTNRRYSGAVRLASLLKHAGSIHLASLADRSIPTLSDVSSIGAALSHAAWNDVLMMPVLTSKGELLGGIMRSTLDRAVRDASSDPAESRKPGAPVLFHLVGAWLTVVAGLVRTASIGGVPVDGDSVAR